MKRIPNTMIRASAGTGKTYQLTNRFIRLLLFGAAPERIIALTFTRRRLGNFSRAFWISWPRTTLPRL